MPKFNLSIREEELKNKVAAEYFAAFDSTKIIGNIDFCVARMDKSGQAGLFAESAEADIQSVLWAESKRGNKASVHESLVQLILTIGKARTFDTYLPPHYLAAFDAEKIAFIPYNSVMEVFYQNDFNWNVTPSDHGTKEFQQVFDMVRAELEENSLLFYFDGDDADLRAFIKENLGKAGFAKIQVNKNNFVTVYGKWEEAVKPTIAIDWAAVKKMGIISADFFLADLLSEQAEGGGYETIIERLFVLLKQTRYELDRKVDAAGFEEFKTVHFTDRLRAYKNFWNKYERPPKEEYWDYIINRRDLLVPQDIRERKGSFFTPQKWVELSQKYLADVLGENWQDEYYIWDCCAGTGNLLAGLTNKRNIWASTLDKADVEVMKERIANGANLFEDHVFQFDFLNDDFLPQNPELLPRHSERSEESVSLKGSRCFADAQHDRTSAQHDMKGKIPNDLYAILNDEEKRKKLVIYINPPYAEAGDIKQLAGTGQNKTDVAVTTKTYEKYLPEIGIAGRELFAQFFIRIYKEIPGCILGEFSKLKVFQSQNFEKFRTVFRPKFEKGFLIHGDTFDNVKGKFPIGFFLWNLSKTEIFKSETLDVFDNDGNIDGQKEVSSYDGLKTLTDWLISTRNRHDEQKIGYLSSGRNDFQNQKLVYIVNDKSQLPVPRGNWITDKNLIETCIFVSARLCIDHTWLNDRDQFLYPSDGWKSDLEFQTNCLVFTLFHGQNRISGNSALLAPNSSLLTTNHFIPFTEDQVGCRKSFASHFMSDFLRDFLAGKIRVQESKASEPDLFGKVGMRNEDSEISNDNANSSLLTSSSLSPQAKAVYDAGLELWKYYHGRANANPNASFYDIRAYFQGTKNGRMNNDSDDARYTQLIADLRAKMKALTKAIQGKVYEYGFLR